jgi:hypothetical protein
MKVEPKIREELEALPLRYMLFFVDPRYFGKIEVSNCMIINNHCETLGLSI